MIMDELKSVTTETIPDTRSLGPELQTSYVSMTESQNTRKIVIPPETKPTTSNRRAT